MKFKLVGTKSMNIKEKDINLGKLSDNFTKISVSFGIVMISASIFMASFSNFAKNNKDTKIEMAALNVNNTSVSSELKDMLDNEYVEDVDWLCSYLKLIDKYEKSEELEKYSIKDKLLNDYKKIEDRSLNLLKKKVAKDNKTSVDHVKIYVGRNGKYALIDDKKVHLKNDEAHFAESVACFQGYSEDKLRLSKNEDVFGDYMKVLKDIAIDSVKMIDNEVDYHMSGIIGYIR